LITSNCTRKKRFCWGI